MKHEGIEYSDDELNAAYEALKELYKHNLIGKYADPDEPTRDVLLVLKLAEDAPTPDWFRISNKGRTAIRLGGIDKYIERKLITKITRNLQVWIPILISVILGVWSLRLADKNNTLREKQQLTTEQIKEFSSTDSLLHQRVIQLQLRIDTLCK